MFALLLRFLLCISLILNGSGFAMASPHARMAHTDSMAMPVVSPEATAATEPPCHTEQHSAVHASEVSDEAHDGSPADSKSPAPDCCASDTCQCACMHQAQAAIPLHALTHGIVEHTGGARMRKSGHPAPALPHLIRPPIG